MEWKWVGLVGPHIIDPTLGREVEVVTLAEAEARIEKQAKAIDFLQRANKRLRVYKQFVAECYGYEFENWKRGRS